LEGEAILPTIRLVNVSKKSDGLLILKNINLEIPDKTLYCITGPPRSGKSALGRIIAGLETPDTGRVLFDDQDVTELGPIKRNVSMVFQDFALYPNLTAFENIASPLMKLKLPKQEVRKKVLEIAEYLKISHRLTHYPSELSGGEKQRVAIARALVKGAQIIILDEPFLRLDYKVREDMRIELYRLQKDVGVNVIILSSDPIDAMTFSENIAFILDGEVIQTGNLTELYESPKNIPIAKYLGVIEMNFILAKITEENNEKFLDTGIGKIKVPDTLQLSEGEILIGIRPEHIYIKEDSVSSVTSILTFKGKVKIAEVIGSDTIVHLDVGLVEPVRILIPTIYKKSPGEVLEAAFNIKDMYFFDVNGRFLCRGSDILG
jgi:ABC-type sugar transport system ATPase subunit